MVNKYIQKDDPVYDEDVVNKRYFDKYNIYTKGGDIEADISAYDITANGDIAATNDISAGGDVNVGGDIYLDDIKMVDIGSNSNGNYVKFSNGFMICWNSVNVGSVTCTEAAGNVYRGGINALTFSQTFSSSPFCVLTPLGNDGNHGVWIGKGNSSTTTSTQSAFLYSYRSQTIANQYIAYVAIGKWK